jgi:hypothetical protein
VCVSLVTQHAKRMRHIVTCGLSCKMALFPKKKLLNIKCVLIPIQLLSGTFLILRKIQRDITNVRTSSCELPVILSDMAKLVVFRKFANTPKYWRVLNHVRIASSSILPFHHPNDHRRNTSRVRGQTPSGLKVEAVRSPAASLSVNYAIAHDYNINGGTTL